MDLFKLMNDARKMQSQMKKLQKEIRKIREEGSSKDGNVKVVLSGEYNLEDIEINEITDGKKLKKAVKEAFQNARKKVDTRIKELTNEYMKGIPKDVQGFLS